MRGSWVLALVVVSSPAAGQSFNVDFGTSGPVPSATYAGVGLAGVWNSVGVLPPGQRQNLVGLDGQATTARVYMIGGTQMLEADDHLTSGDDAALLDDMLIGYNNPTDVCLWVENLLNDEYEIVTYALTPSSPTLKSPVRVDFGSPGSIDVGGTWSGTHSEGLSYARHVVTITNGRIGFHSGTPSGYFQSGMNGFQIRPTSTTAVNPGVTPRNAIRSVAPNPSAGHQRIDLDLATSGLFTLEVLDVAGRLVWRHAMVSAAGPHAVEWDGRDLGGSSVPAGIYLARLVSPGVTLGSGGFRKILRTQ